MPRMGYSLPLNGHSLRDVVGQGRFKLCFDDTVESCLQLDGTFIISTGGEANEFAPPFPHWVRDVILSLVGVRIESARYDRESNLQIKFADGRELSVRDGPYENWHYLNNIGASLHGGVGRVS
jgi:hypothetical protein